MNSQQPSKMDIRRATFQEEKKRRLMNLGMSAEQAESQMASEAYKNMSLEKRVELTISAMDAAIKALSRDVAGLRDNDGIIADTMDMNTRFISRCLVAAGVPLDKQRELITQVEQEFHEERRKALEAASVQKVSSQVDVEGEPPPHPEDATTFGG